MSVEELDELDDFDGTEKECPECGGEGWVEGDCFEDTCCCADPASSHGLVKCSLCGNKQEAS
jgi:hypothetical protein